MDTEAFKLFVGGHEALMYLVIFLGFFIEADITFILATILANQGYLSVSTLPALAFLGVMMSDALWYFLGRKSNETGFGAWFTKHFDRYHHWLNRNFIARYTRVAFFTRYIYYISRLTPFLAGWHRLNLKRFFTVHLLANLVWLVVMSVIGHSVGFAITAIGTKRVLRRVEYFLIGIAGVFLGGEYFLEKFFVKRLKNGNGLPPNGNNPYA